MKPEDVTVEIVEGVYGMFQKICKPKYPMGRDCTPEDVAERINSIGVAGIELCVTSEFSSNPKLFFEKNMISGNLEVSFLPNLDDFETDDYPFAEEIKYRFDRSVKSYFRHLSKC